MKNPELQHKCNNKLAMSSEHSGTNFDQIRIVANKQEPLTPEDIEQLTHFAHSNRQKLQDTVYYGNAIIEPCTYNNKYYRKLKTGWAETSKSYTKLHVDDK